ncbi:MAG: sulfite exporter TauE/SafE family protein [Pseudobdellovibrionaceae bacterium]
MGLSLGFLFTAALYASIGFGGGSTYTSLLVLFDVDYRFIPLISLTCNILVVSSAVYNFYQSGHIHFQKVVPWIVTSVPAAILGGMVPIKETLFMGVLGCALLLSSLRLLWPQRSESNLIGERPHIKSLPVAIPLCLGGVLGGAAGVTGIGGGIFLAPVLYYMKWKDPKRIAGASSLFILVNSLAGLLGQLIKSGSSNNFMLCLETFWFLLPLVLAGGWVGSNLGSAKLDKDVIKRLTALLIFYVAVRLLYQSAGTFLSA